MVLFGIHEKYRQDEVERARDERYQIPLQIPLYIEPPWYGDQPTAPATGEERPGWDQEGERPHDKVERGVLIIDFM